MAGGQPNLGHTADLKIAISPSLDAALNRLVVVSGVSKAAIVRDALTRHLAEQGVLSPVSVIATTPTLTRRPAIHSPERN
jgi:hypothetical protein